MTKELPIQVCVPADGNERSVWVVDEHGKRINFFNIIRYESGTVVLIQNKVRIDFWKKEGPETHQPGCLTTMLVPAPGSGDNSRPAPAPLQAESL